MAFKYVVLGGGNASGYAAEEFLKKGASKGELCIISAEPYVSYERPALSKAYLSPESPARLPGFHTCVGGGGERQTPEWYEEKGITFKTSTKVTQADIKAKTLKTDQGDTIQYEKLIIATGARPTTLADFKTPGADLEGIYYLRDVEDANKLYAAIQEARTSGKKKCLVVGGGYIGMECAAKLLDNDLDVTMVFPEERLMQRLFTPEMSEYYTAIFAAKGTKFVNGNGCLVTQVHGEGKATSVTLKNGESLDADLIIVGTGARPNTQLFDDQLKMAPVNPSKGQIGGIEVNEFMQTSDADVYSVGDVAAFPLKKYNTVTRQEHVTNCRSSARQAVDHIMDPSNTTAYDYLPFFYSRIFDLSWKYYGVSDGKPVFFKGEGKKIGTLWIDSDGKVTGAFLESGTPEEEALIQKLAKENPVVNPSDVTEKGLAACS